MNVVAGIKKIKIKKNEKKNEILIKGKKKSFKTKIISFKLKKNLKKDKVTQI